jgi:hypothetical protein
MTTTETDLSGATLPLTPGIWEIVYSLSIQLSVGSSVGQFAARTKVTNASNVDLAGTQRASFMGAAAGTGMNTVLHSSVIVNITNATTYKIRVITAQPSGTGGGASLFNSPGSPQFTESVFYARRIG